jgi:hypothetical protein
MEYKWSCGKRACQRGFLDIRRANNNEKQWRAAGAGRH